MKIDLSGDSDIAAAVREGVRDALLDPRFGRELLLELAGRFIFVTLDEAAEIIGHDVRTVRRWATKNKVEWSTAFGDRQKRYRLGSIREGMRKKTVLAKRPPSAPAAPAPPPLPAPAPALPPKPAVNGNGHQYQTVPAVPLRHVKMLVKPVTP